MPENICLTTKPRGECFFLISFSKRCKAKALGLCFCHLTSPPSCPTSSLRHRAEPAVRAGLSRIYPCCCKRAQSRALDVTDLHVSHPLSLSHLSHTLSLQFASELLDTSTFTSDFPSDCLRALHGWTDEGNVLNSPFARDEFPGDCSY